VAIVGPGLLGASFGLALRRRGLARSIVGIGRSQETLDAARAVGAIDDTATDLPAAVRGAELVVVCTPVDHIAADVVAAARAEPAALITDVGSTKASIVATVESALPETARWVGSHPLAGGAKSGPAHASADLFVGRTVVVTPTALTGDEVRRRVQELWQSVGANVVVLSPADHDQAVASISHLPHVLASLLCGSTPAEHLPLAAAGFLGTTRIAAGSPAMWRAILLDNRTPILAALGRFAAGLHDFERLLAAGDGAGLEAWLARGKARRDALAD
jgi:prephenate dehydrogenase